MGWDALKLGKKKKLRSCDLQYIYQTHDTAGFAWTDVSVRRLGIATTSANNRQILMGACHAISLAIPKRSEVGERKSRTHGTFCILHESTLPAVSPHGSANIFILRLRMKHVYCEKGLVPTMHAHVVEAVEDIDDDDAEVFAERIDPVRATRLCTMSMGDVK